MKNYLRIGAWALLWPFVAIAQTPGPTINATVSGRIVDQRTSEPLVGASVQIKGTTNGAVTDATGKFQLRTGQILPFTLLVS
ncbi:MAG: carboxypeptidase-like regulatory domain-containing protein, partial [Sphingobacteriaceae bacterium]|nr:carboxypeptidase-like regulatory domain-containing protein [Cytophagaceae bacterium]